ncbi:site-specific DNA-methyltransferase [Salinisphaera japonica]|uniref:site-specific DNA-methyltransferase (adenine-specific) n=1 Tax=Salinisphaera japonica YTM-1 TaxID=1209778 RepID=A0A423PPP7_9GAMM|nr:site-specific DNA-methyltransferase [Salinisphaera japonica]ROO27501.1 DNA methylase N-4 [Salinisphaera japonica YTM-1]
MDKLDPKTDGTSQDIVADNIDKLRELFPDAFTEGSDADGPRWKVDFDALKACLGEYVEDERERYSFTWNGKDRARRIAQTPSTGTLRPCPEESVNWESTQNLFIEGDNLEVLKLLQKSYHKQVKMIYIDPPYNTGGDFIYPDRFQDNLDTYLRYTGQVDGNGFKTSSNSESAGRYHTNWLNMMYPRLRLARNLLKDDGVIFVSIDDHEVQNLRQIMDEVFGPENFITQFTWKTDGNFDNQARIKRCHEYILLYAKYESNFPLPPVVDPSVPRNSKIFREEIRNTIVKNGPKNPVSSITLPEGFPAAFSSGSIRCEKSGWPQYASDAKIANGKLFKSVSVSSGWSSRDLLEQFIDNRCNAITDAKGQLTSFEISQSGAIEAVKKRSDNPSHVISVISGLGGSQKATAELEEIGVPFDDYPKPSELLKYLIAMVAGNDFIVLDFFSGSSTTAHAVLKANAQDEGARRFIMCQLPEPCSSDTIAAKSGFDNIAQIGKERIKQALNSLGVNQCGFKVFKLSDSNIVPWVPSDDDIKTSLFDNVDNIRHDRSEADVLSELLLKYGLDLAVPIEAREINGKTVHIIGAGALVVCLADAVDLNLVNGIAALKAELAPEVMRVVFKDNGFADDVVKTNAVQILRQASVEDVKSL